MQERLKNKKINRKRDTGKMGEKASTRNGKISR